jgi:hypothetical protein
MNTVRSFFEKSLPEKGWRMCASVQSGRRVLIAFSQTSCIDPENSIEISPLDSRDSPVLIEMEVENENN